MDNLDLLYMDNLNILYKIFDREDDDLHFMWAINKEHKLYGNKDLYISFREINNCGIIITIDKDIGKIIKFIEGYTDKQPNIRLYITPKNCTNYKKLRNLIDNYYGFGIKDSKEYIYKDDTIKELGN